MATVALRPRGSAGREPASALLLRRALRDGRTRTISFAALFAAVSYIQPIAYQRTYATVAERLAFAHSFANNKAVVLFYGKAYDLLTVGGYTAWRVGGTLTIFAAVFGLLAAVRALRAEEDAGRTELVLAAGAGRAPVFWSALASIGASTLLLWLAVLGGLLAAGLPADGSAYLALAVTSVIPVSAGVGALASQLAPTKRVATELGGACVALWFLLRVVADTSSGAGWLRWFTPLGWAEELRPFTGARPLVLLAPLAASALLIGAASRIAGWRDVGTGLLASRDTAQPRLRLLSSPVLQALRSERGGLLVWVVAVGGQALVIGMVSKSVSTMGVSKQLAHTLTKLGAGRTLSAKAYIGLSFSFFAVVVSLFCISQMVVARHEEAEGRLETLLALPISRRRWLGGRLGLAAAGAAVISLCAGVLAWAGAVSQGVSLSLVQMLEAGANCLPVALLFLGIAALLLMAFPRAGTAIAYGLLTVAYLWQLFGALLGAPRWLVQATPFAHVGAVPAAAFRPGAAALMLALGLVAALAATRLFERRDLVTA